ncbi:BrnA antitoxin family protein [Geomonas ferrireducens]|uniref:BrnA antitoxin family protein n=1 Tax=Geomonas ferrireducens TaxID=2570227 RepID=UPI0010A768CF|nr:BrnA antitoxin family protein [Geomonas ferrireducens]
MKKRDSKTPSQTDWARVDAIREEEIDYSDIPELGDDFFEKATLTPAKQAITIRLDSDVVTWLKEGGKGYQTRANRILRSVMEAQRKRDGVSAPSRKGTRPS